MVRLYMFLAVDYYCLYVLMNLITYILSIFYGVSYVFFLIYF